MKVAMAVIEVFKNINKNKDKIIRFILEAAEKNADLIIFPEVAISGLQDKNDYKYDLTLCEEINDEYINKVRKLALENQIMVSLGFFEKDQGNIYDSSVLIDKSGEIIQHYRRVDSHWALGGADRSIYRNGKEVYKTSTEYGSFSTILCGDLFNDEVVNMLIKLKPDYLLYPLCMCLEDDVTWENASKEYGERVNLFNVKTIMVNSLDGEPLGEEQKNIGGAHVFNEKGEIIESFEMYREGLFFSNIK
jgi:predicted amidohydrolase